MATRRESLIDKKDHPSIEKKNFEAHEWNIKNNNKKKKIEKKNFEAISEQELKVKCPQFVIILFTDVP